MNLQSLWERALLMPRNLAFALYIVAGILIGQSLDHNSFLLFLLGGVVFSTTLVIRLQQANR